MDLRFTRNRNAVFQRSQLPPGSRDKKDAAPHAHTHASSRCEDSAHTHCVGRLVARCVTGAPPPMMCVLTLTPPPAPSQQPRSRGGGGILPHSPITHRQCRGRASRRGHRRCTPTSGQGSMLKSPPSGGGCLHYSTHPKGWAGWGRGCASQELGVAGWAGGFGAGGVGAAMHSYGSRPALASIRQ